MIQPSFRDLLREAIKHFSTSGYTSEAELHEWTMRLHHALDAEMPGNDETKKLLADVLQAIYTRDVTKLALLKKVPGITRYTVDRIAPELRAELDRRIYAGIDLIKLNRQKRMQETLQRFAGWVSSIPQSGSNADLREVASHITKPSKQVRFEARRVAIDQAAKLSSGIAHVVAMQNGAIAAVWHDKGEHDSTYDARPEHLRRSEQIYLIRDSWAHKEGLVKPGPAGYLDDITQPGQEVYCQCYVTYLPSPRDLPENMVTARGRLWVKGSAA